MNVRHRTIRANNIDLHVVEAGDEKARPVFFLHGFPDFWYTWQQQMEFLATQGFLAIAPDQRGYNESSKPVGIASYSIDVLAADVIGILDAYRCERALIVGHDWGGSVAWRTAHVYPERVEKLVILNVPHSAVLKRAVRKNRKQMARSWYIFFFQLPWLPESLLSAFHYALLKKVRRSGGPLSDQELLMYVKAWSMPGALHGMMQWYRALLQTKARRMPSPRITPPVRVIWGSRDRYLRRELAQQSLDLCDHGELLFIENAGHWIHHEKPDEVNRLISEFFAGS